MDSVGMTKTYGLVAEDITAAVVVVVVVVVVALADVADIAVVAAAVAFAVVAVVVDIVESVVPVVPLFGEVGYYLLNVKSVRYVGISTVEISLTNSDKLILKLFPKSFDAVH